MTSDTTTTAITTYVYSSLPPPGENEHDIHIRLIKLPPGEETGTISCTMSVHPLSTAPKFEAASYVWGAPEDKTRITCDGQSLLVPTNLNDFLLRTRAKGTERTLWVDSICINQQDPVEKSSQVAAMCHIYRAAMRVLIWLGKDYERSSLGLQTAQELATKYRNIRNNEGTTPKKPWYHQQWYHDFISVWDPKWGAFLRLFDRPYWTRAWIVQEVAVSQNQYIICGQKAIPWNDFICAYVYCVTVEPWILEFYGSKNMNALMCMQISQMEVVHQIKPPHYRVLIRHRACSATDERDKIFAYHGISAHESFKTHAIKPDYELTTEELYVNCAVTTLRAAKDLDFLDIPRALQNPANLPSWVPYWAIDPGELSLSFLQLENTHIPGTPKYVPPFQATKGSLCAPVIDDSNTRLELSGYTVDRIVKLTRAWEVQDTSGYSSLLKQAKILQKNQTFVKEFVSTWGQFSGAIYPTGESRSDVAWQTCVCGTYEESKDVIRKKWLAFQGRQYWLRWIDTLHLQQFLFPWLLVVIIGHILRLFGIQNSEMEFRVLTTKLINRKAAATLNGYVGLVPKIAEVGDHIVLAKGGKLPLILREQGKNWEFIGDVYVHGMMSGELWDGGEDGKTKCEKLVIL